LFQFVLLPGWAVLAFQRSFFLPAMACEFLFLLLQLLYLLLNSL
jgi:hypothetical protein